MQHIEPNFGTILLNPILNLALTTKLETLLVDLVIKYDIRDLLIRDLEFESL